MDIGKIVEVTEVPEPKKATEIFDPAKMPAKSPTKQPEPVPVRRKEVGVPA